LRAIEVSQELDGTNAVSAIDGRRSAMFKVLAFLTKKKGLGMQAFIDYYENKHIPLIRSLATTPVVYKRSYLVPDDGLTDKGKVDFDVVTELGFPDCAAFQAWMAQLSGPGAGDQVAADEARFLDRSRTRAYVIEEHTTSG
jgi:uncharacterized protein (TIGR02118 family)